MNPLTLWVDFLLQLKGNIYIREIAAMKKSPETTAKPEIKIKENPKAEAMKKAPDEVIAMAIRDAMLKEKEKR